MYYFIFEQPGSKRQHELAQQIEDAVVAQGIAGELTMADVYTDLDELLAAAHHKGFQTVVVVGGSGLVNRVATRLIRYEMVLGIIPWEPSPSLTELTGVSDWNAAITALKQRRWRFVALGRINDSEAFLVRVQLGFKRASEIIRLRTDDYSIHFNATSASLWTRAHDLKEHAATFECLTVPHSLSTWQRLVRSKPEPPFSRISAPTFYVETDTPLPITLDQEVIAHTPVRITTLPRAVRVITARHQGDKK